MRRGLLGLALGMVLGALPLTADCDSCGEWSAGAHALYFTPISCPFTYASALSTSVTPEVTLTQGAAQQVPCDASWGFRVFGNYFDSCWYMGASYQWLEISNQDRVVADSLVIPAPADFPSPFAGSVVGRTCIEYQNADVRVGTNLPTDCCITSYVFANARWVDISYRRSLFAQNSISGATQRVNEKSQLDGAAIGVGLGAQAVVGCNVGAFIEGNALGVIGQRSTTDVEFVQQFSPTFTSAQRQRYPSETCIVPEFDFRVGLDYTLECGCWTFVGELGFEVDYFWQAVAFPDLNGIRVAQNEEFFSLVCEDIGFSGLFFGARVLF